MNVFLAALVVVAFALVVERLGLPARAREAAGRARESAEVLGDPDVEDDEKERRLRRQSLRLFGLVGVLAGGSALALGLPLGGVWLLERAGVGTLAGVLAVLERVDFLVGATVVGTAAYLVARRSRTA